MTGDDSVTTETSPTYLLPVDAYLDPDWLAREQRSLFARTWALVGSSSDLVNPGDWLTAVVGGVPIVVVMDDTAAIRAFHNVCRHRGMAMMEGRGTGCRTIRCSYHDWRFGLDGTLTVVPQRSEQFPDIDTDEFGLRPAAVAVWEGMVFACPDPAVAPLDAVLGDFANAIGSFHPGLLPVVASADLPAACNWKLLVENHIDVYHLWYLHRDSLADFDHPRFEHRPVGTHWVSYEPLRESAGEQRLATGVPIRHLTGRDSAGIGAHLLFPNILIASTAEFFMTYAVIPEGPAQSRLELRIRAEPDADPALLLAAARSFIAEDITACERIQAAMASPWFSVGPLARTHEAPLATFQQHILQHLGERQSET